MFKNKNSDFKCDNCGVREKSESIMEVTDTDSSKIYKICMKCYKDVSFRKHQMYNCFRN